MFRGVARDPTSTITGFTTPKRLYDVRVRKEGLELPLSGQLTSQHPEYPYLMGDIFGLLLLYSRKSLTDKVDEDITFWESQFFLL